jgi:hypothetical protein
VDYEDFSIKIEPRRGDVYPVIVLRSPAGEGRSEFSLPFDPARLGSLLSDMGETVRGIPRAVPEEQAATTRSVSPGATLTLPQQVGDQLFSALFQGAVLSLYDRSLGMTYGQGRGLRVKLHIDPEEGSLSQLVSLPWEFLYRKETRDFLNLSRSSPVVRYLDVSRPYAPLDLEPPLRVLVIISAPKDAPPLDLERERRQIEASWAQQPGVQVDFITRATVLELQDRLSDKRYHALHFMGHGDFDERTGRGALLMEDELGAGSPLDGSTLGVLLRDVSSLRLVFLNACETARVSRTLGLDPFSGVASSLVLAGVPAVVAMQFPITDRAALTFAHRFYALVARGEPVDAAVAEGRRAVRISTTDTMEWGTPVLFMRAPQGELFRVSQPAPGKTAPLPELEAPPKTETETAQHARQQILQQLYTEALSAYWLEDWDKAVENFERVVKMQGDYREAGERLKESRQRAHQAGLRRRADAAQQAGDWPEAMAALEELSALLPDDRPLLDQIEHARQQKGLAELYAEARQMSQVEQWQAVVNIFRRIEAIDPGYADPEGLLGAAQERVAALEKAESLAAQYQGAVEALDRGEWVTAEELLQQVIAAQPDHPHAARLLEKARAERTRLDSERQRVEKSAVLYQDSVADLKNGHFQQVLDKLAELRALDPDFADPQRVAEQAQAGLADLQARTANVSRTKELYEGMARLLEAGSPEQALAQWQAIQEIDPRFRDWRGLAGKARGALAAQAQAAAELSGDRAGPPAMEAPGQAAQPVLRPSSSAVTIAWFIIILLCYVALTLIQKNYSPLIPITAQMVLSYIRSILDGAGPILLGSLPGIVAAASGWIVGFCGRLGPTSLVLLNILFDGALPVFCIIMMVHVHKYRKTAIAWCLVTGLFATVFPFRIPGDAGGFHLSSDPWFYTLTTAYFWVIPLIILLTPLGSRYLSEWLRSRDLKDRFFGLTVAFFAAQQLAYIPSISPYWYFVLRMVPSQYMVQTLSSAIRKSPVTALVTAGVVLFLVEALRRSGIPLVSSSLAAGAQLTPASEGQAHPVAGGEIPAQAESRSLDRRFWLGWIGSLVLGVIVFFFLGVVFDSRGDYIVLDLLMVGAVLGFARWLVLRAYVSWGRWMLLSDVLVFGIIAIYGQSSQSDSATILLIGYPLLTLILVPLLVRLAPNRDQR